MLTYESLRKIRDSEISQKGGLSSLPEDFFESVKTFIENKSRLSEGEEDSWEVENAKHLLEDILKARELKLLVASVGMASNREAPENMLPEERKFLEAVAGMIKDFRSRRLELSKEEPENRSNVAFLEDLPAFVGTDMKEYGPFRKGDMASLPEDVANLLVEKSAARRIGP
jgi:DNA replication factor GINS